MIIILPLALFAYLLGSVSPAYLIGRHRGLDLRDSGSGNLGASNAGEHLGWRVGVCILLLDALKSAVATLVGLWVAGYTGGVIAGLCSIIGHNWSAFLGFSGGRGVVCLITVLVFLAPVVAFLAFGIIMLGYALRRPAPGCAVAFAALPVMAWYFSEPSATRWLCAALPVLMFAKRILANDLRRLAARDAGSVLFWRIVCDRDIADDAAWTGRRSHADASP